MKRLMGASQVCRIGQPVTQAGVPIGQVVSVKRLYTVRGAPTAGLSQIYTSLGDSGAGGSIGVRL